VPSEPTLTLFIPDLFGFQSILPTLSKDELSQLPTVEFPVLEKWLSRGLIEKPPHQDNMFFSEFGLLIEQDKSHAALSLLAEKETKVEVNTETYWLRADPVNMQPDGDTALLTAHEELALTQEEANKLVEKINEHFIDEPWILFTFSPHRWYLRLDKSADLVTTPLANVLGEDIAQFMPEGDDANYWWKITNELQMLLHGSNVNFERESRNIITANSVWLWGGGCLPENNLNSHYDNIITNSIFFSGVGHYCGFDVLPVKDGFLDGIEMNNNFVVLDMLSEYVQRRDLYTFMQVLNELETTFLLDANNLLIDGKVAKIKLVTNEGMTITITKKHLRRWWEHIKPFSGFKNA
jgi:hypothetical protein